MMSSYGYSRTNIEGTCMSILAVSIILPWHLMEVQLLFSVSCKKIIITTIIK